MPKTIAFIPARGGSKGLPNKNILSFCGKPLVAWSIEQALAATNIDEVYVSTDSTEIAAIAEAHGALVPFLRPEDISDDKASTESAMLHFCEYMKSQNQHFDLMVLLQPTSPVRRSNVLDQALQQLEANNNDSLLSVSVSHRFFWKNVALPQATYDYKCRPRRQDIADGDRWYMETGSFYITKRETLEQDRNRLGGSVGMFVTSELESYEIDTECDFKVCEVLMSELLKMHSKEAGS